MQVKVYCKFIYEFTKYNYTCIFIVVGKFTFQGEKNAL